jgi:predicted nucleotidyltransferase
MDKRTDKGIRDFITSIAAQNHDLEKAFLFGSYARGNRKIDSDIYLALDLIT